MFSARILNVAALLPPLFLVALHVRYALDFPMLDQWEVAPLLCKDSVGWREVFAPHNGHVPAVPRIVFLGLAWVSGWDVRWETTGSLLCAGAVFFLLRKPGKPWFNLLLSTLIFTAVQWQNFLLGWQLQLMLCMLLGVVCLHSLMRAARQVPLLEGGCRGMLPLAIGCAFAATFSFAAGLLLWPIGALLLSTSRQFKSLVVWLLSTTIAITLYGLCLHGAGGSDANFSANAFSYVLAYIGAPVFPYGGLGASIVGGVAVFVALAVFLGTPLTPLGLRLPFIDYGTKGARLLRMDQLFGQERGFALSLVLLALGSAVLTAFARSDHGVEQALSSRYATLAILFWVGLILEAHRQWAEATSPPAAPAPLQRGTIRAIATLAVIQLVVISASLYGAYRWSEHANAYRLARPALLELRPAPELRWVYPPDEAELLRRAAALKARGLSLYRP